MRNLDQTIFILLCTILLSACGLVDLGDVGLGNGEVESFVDDVQNDLGIGPSRTPTPGTDATATPTRTPQPTLFPTNTPGATGPILTGAIVSGAAGSNSLQIVEVTLSGEVYIVVRGDTLGEIAQSFNVTTDELYSANLGLVTDIDIIEIGWELQIPE
ncbi:MAG: hypothetical protein ACI9EW_002748 [Cellvibrionaceae bacterium]|jgi:hypothetical protein